MSSAGSNVPAENFTPTTSVDGDYAISSPSVHQEYRYKSLDTRNDSIRLLVLQPWNESDGLDPTVRFDLINVSFREKPVFEALSYMWGEEQPSSSAILDGVRVSVRQTLYDALLNLRYSSETRTLWADAICINQNDLVERAYQVGLMNYIYSRAHTVLVCLGPSTSLFKLLEVAGYHPSSRNCFYTENFGEAYWIWLTWICDNPYWRRLWIIQEIGLAVRLMVCIERESLPWSEFVWKFSSLMPPLGLECYEDSDLQRLTSTYCEGQKLISNLQKKRNGRHTNSNLLEVLLEDFEYAKCSEVRDRIFGFLGLSHDCDDETITPDYTKHLYGIYQEVIEFFCRRRLLPNFATNELDRSMRLVKFSQLVQNLLGITHREIVISTDAKTLLRVKGANVGSIIQLGPTYDEIIGSSKANRQWRMSFPEQYPLPQETQRLREAFEAYLGVLLGLKSNEIREISSIYCCSNPDQFWSVAVARQRNWTGKPDNWHRQDPDDRLDAGPNKFCRTLSRSPETEPRMFLGTNHLMGLVPSDAEVGDIICQFWETNVAALLRQDLQKDSGVDVYRVVGRVHLNTGRLDILDPIYDPWVPIPENADAMVIEMALETLSFLTS